MRRLAECFSADEIGQQAVDQLPWSHLIRITTAVNAREAQLFYIEKSIENNWSHETLKTQIENRLYERAGKAVTNFQDRLPANVSNLAIRTLNDPYCFDFLGIHDEAQEKAIENALVQHMEKFLIELGAGFAFVGRQYKLVVSETAYYLDLLFYHTKLHCYVVVEAHILPANKRRKRSFLLATMLRALECKQRRSTEHARCLSILEKN
jgi:predicted nuclease of restriction endonuclease-like (RecB) superfamily